MFRPIIILILSLTLFGTVSLNAADAPVGLPFRVAGYLPDYRAADFDLSSADGLTDLILFSAEPQANGELSLDRLKGLQWDKFRAWKTRYRVRLIIAIGGWDRSTHFATVAASPESRQTFAKAVAQVCREQRLDGVDLDWEHPRDAIEAENYGALLADLRSQFQPLGLVLSLTMAGWQQLPKRAIESVDWIQVMAYDHSGRHSTFDGAVADIKRLQTAGAPSSKLVLGLPFYGRHTARPDDVLTYREIVQKHAPKPNVDEVQGIYFNGPETIRRKTQWARDSGIGGVMIWELGQDAPDTQSLKRWVLKSLESSDRKKNAR